MAGLTEHLVLPPGGEYRPAVVPEILDDRTPIPEITREQQRRTANVVLNRFGDSDEARTVLAMLVQPAREDQLSASGVRRRETAVGAR